jgi:hypothetical protein
LDTFVPVIMTIKKTAVLMAAVLAVATSLATGLAIIPGSVENAQANPCTENSIAASANTEVVGGAEGGGVDADVDEQNTEASPEIDCDLTGIVVEETVTVEQAPPIAATEEEAEEEAEDAEFE